MTKKLIAYKNILSFGNRPKYFWDIIFLILFISVSLGFTYHEILFKRPQGVHVWRQTDCTSMALNYYQHDLPLLEPRMHHKFENDSQSLGEFPGLYYLVGDLYKIFGFHEYLYRFLWLLIALAGSFSLYRLAFEMLELPVESLLTGLLLISSPVSSFYSISFIADPAAMYIMCVAIYLLYKAYLNNSAALIFAGMTLMALSGVLKISSLIIPFSALVVFVIYGFYIRNWKVFFYSLGTFLLVALINFCWYSYAIEFNESRNNHYFFVRIAPFWEVSQAVRSELLDLFYNYRLPEFYNRLMLVLVLILIGVGLKGIRKNVWWSFFVISAFSGVVLFFLLFFQQFRYHDYYMINLILLIPALVIFGLRELKEMMMGRNVAIFIKIILIFIFTRNVIISANFTKRRFREPENNYYETRGYFDIESYLNEIGITRESLVISLPDESLNTTLYLMNRDGWTGLYMNPLSANRIDKLIKRGADYILIGDEKVMQDSTLSEYFSYPVGKYKEISIFKLQAR